LGTDQYRMSYKSCQISSTLGKWKCHVIQNLSSNQHSQTPHSTNPCCIQFTRNPEQIQNTTNYNKFSLPQTDNSVCLNKLSQPWRHHIHVKLDVRSIWQITNKEMCNVHIGNITLLASIYIFILCRCPLAANKKAHDCHWKLKMRTLLRYDKHCTMEALMEKWHQRKVGWQDRNSNISLVYGVHAQWVSISDLRYYDDYLFVICSKYHM